ncbi:MAG TPA: glycosyltransferase [Sphingobium sp.]|uniref:glycosyltransferase n=1 Tax=Sphingobium sp. TaxID=1912891 RepID=UPI002ED0F12C
MSFHPPYLLYGLLSATVGLVMYLFGVLLFIPRYILPFHQWWNALSEWLVWYSGIPLVLGLVLTVIDLLYLFSHRKPDVPVRYDPVAPRVTVALTAYNDEESITEAVQDFLAHPAVARVIVVSNNSRDATFQRAEAAGAITINELQPGYGRCVFRCLSEAARYEDADLVVLCEGDRTFRSYDIDKLLAYAPHCDIVNGTRIVEPLRQYRTQLSTFMYYGNLFVAKLLEAKHLGRGTLTDVGTTYKLCRRSALERLLPAVDPAINLEFNAHLLDTALSMELVLVECPITFHERVGVSKGGNVNNWRGFTVGIRMIRGILFNWRWAAT